MQHIVPLSAASRSPNRNRRAAHWEKLAAARARNRARACSSQHGHQRLSELNNSSFARYCPGLRYSATRRGLLTVLVRNRDSRTGAGTGRQGPPGRYGSIKKLTSPFSLGLLFEFATLDLTAIASSSGAWGCDLVRFVPKQSRLDEDG